MQVRQIVLDTETTGLFPNEGHRIIQVACLELINGEVRNNFNVYINPERESSSEALKVHGLTTEFLSDKPKFSDIAESFLQFIKNDELIIHNAPFDLGFLNRELSLLGKPTLSNQVVDTKTFSQQLYSKEFLTSQLVIKKLVKDEKIVQEQKAESESSLIAALVANPKFRVHSLDHLCLYFGINLSSREKHHGALVDCQLLAQVYLQLKKEQHKRYIAVPENNVVTNSNLFQPAQLPEAIVEASSKPVFQG